MDALTFQQAISIDIFSMPFSSSSPPSIMRLNYGLSELPLAWRLHIASLLNSLFVSFLCICVWMICVWKAFPFSSPLWRAWPHRHKTSTTLPLNDTRRQTLTLIHVCPCVYKRDMNMKIICIINCNTLPAKKLKYEKRFKGLCVYQLTLWWTHDV